jgi:hypothetical protein
MGGGPEAAAKAMKKGKCGLEGSLPQKPESEERKKTKGVKEKMKKTKGQAAHGFF